ncbi:MAG: PEP/pyruvate-binding domain-containing protein [Pseudomonadota bacterium]
MAGGPIRGQGLLQRLLFWRKREGVPFAEIFGRFQSILQKNTRAMEIIGDMGGKLGGEFIFDKKYLMDCAAQIGEVTRDSAFDLNFITGNRYLEVYEVLENLGKELELELAGKIVVHQRQNIYRLEDIAENMEDVVGNKAYNLSRVAMLPYVRVPSGFVVTIAGFRGYLAYNNLFEKIEALVAECAQGGRGLDSISQAIRLMVLGGDIQPELRREILSAAEGICQANPERCFFSVRSSALGEDGDLSFAGIHDSFMNVPFRELLSNYKKVLASLYSPASLEYRLKKRLLPMEMAMPVLYQVMVNSRVAGVVFTLDPADPGRQECLVSASWGLGRVVVEGMVSVDNHWVSRQSPHLVREEQIGHKVAMLAPLEAGPPREVAAGDQDRSCLSPPEIADLAELALTLERFFKRPLDIEWSQDQDHLVWLLQARSLGVQRASRARGPELTSLLAGRAELMRERGVIAYRGIGAGPVCLVEEGDDLNLVPGGAVVVARYSSPWLAKVIPRVSAIITDVGSTTGHLATVAREFHVPAIVDAQIASKVLKPGQEVTVDAERNVVYEGRIEELLHHQLLESAAFETTYEFQLLRRLLKRISPLTLTDPQSPEFAPDRCQTFHDVVRFIHEKAVQALVEVGKDPWDIQRRGGKRLLSSLPLDLVLIDVGGGLVAEAQSQPQVAPEQLASEPMLALWQGLTNPQAWSTDPLPVDFKGLMASLTRTRPADLSQASSGLNLAVLGSNYLNMSLRVGYHFTVVDAYLGPMSTYNYIYFRFMGGVTDLTRRSRRAMLLSAILEESGFKVEVTGDLVVARVKKMSQEHTRELLVLLGHLIGFARQLDIMMKDDSAIDTYFERFMDQQHNLQGGPFARGE